MNTLKRYLPLATIFFVLAVGVVMTTASLMSTTHAQGRQEFLDFHAKNPYFPEELEAFRTLLKRVGAREAQAILLEHMPNDSRTHALDHEAGAFLYRTEGAKGAEDCLPYLAGGCYHGFITGILAAKGFENFTALVAECESALETEQRTQCAHGVGHAMLEHVGYPNLPEALTMCKEKFLYDQKSAENCYDGVFMENSFGIFNVPPPERFYRQSDPMYPCNEEYVTSKQGARKMCWGMLSQLTMNPHAFPQFKGLPTLASQYCDTLNSKQDQEICQEGIARQIQLNHPDNTKVIIETCGTLPKRHVPYCIARAMEASYMYGDRSKETLSICNSFSETDKPVCYLAFYEGIAISFSSSTIRVEACRTLPEESFQKKCIEWMDTPEALSF